MDDETINALKREWTGKQVAIDPALPRHRRFSGKVGTVVTINMNGRALIRFEETLDTGWFDIPVDAISLVTPESDDEPAGKTDAPASPEPSERRGESSPSEKSDPAPADAPEKPTTASILEMARRQGAARKAD